MVELLRAIEADQDDFASVKALNLLILKEIILAELRQDKHRAKHKELKRQLKTGRGTKEVSRALRTKIKRTAGFIDRCAKQIYIWKCCGDALAFLYLDKFAIKHAYFDTDRFAIKRDAGMIRGKVGLVGELTCLFSALEHKVPAVLSDITNTIRFGDVCLLGASDPVPIEVKSSPKQNGRGKRQAEAIEKLRSFLETDRAVGYRGAPGETKRQAVNLPERTNVEALNACIADAKRTGFAISRPEPGVAYAVIAGGQPDYAAIVGPFADERGAFWSLNGDKNDFAWAPYMPFILTIRDPQHLLDFIEGRIFIIVGASMDELCRQMAAPGWQIAFDPASDYALHCVHESGGVVGISQQFVARVAYEFVSLSWIADCQRKCLETLRAGAMNTYGPFQPVDVAQMHNYMFGERRWLRSDAEAFFVQDSLGD
ncbi:hypothetical protein K3181_13290 [Qipengyuania sp. YG27]|uniref:Uncharacterized protein n=1 Tax=Qipengyuania mesophila TaxID=2867246 RepID=A0ABS7JXR9_9SPHN|nr:hypothetical protein [Qipengyuania mesophila]MBX7502416.1 hypothetical protein [Qipengyuania mesophila]